MLQKVQRRTKTFFNWLYDVTIKYKKRILVVFESKLEKYMSIFFCKYVLTFSFLISNFLIF